MSKGKLDLSKLAPQTRLIAAGREQSEHGFISPAVYHGSTILLPDVDTFRNRPYAYARRGTPTSKALEQAIAGLEGGYDAVITPSGLSAISTTLLAYLNAGDHLLVTDAVYSPARHFCDTVLKRLGIETSYFDPGIGSGIAAMIRSNTRLVYCETPGAQTMEIPDIPAIAAAAHDRGCLMMLDNSWSGGYYFRSFEHSCDISLQSATKYLGGHSDVMMGCVTTTKEAWAPLKAAYGAMGLCAGPDDIYLTLRGIRTLDVRLARHMSSAIRVAEWLRGRAEVDTVLHPALSNAPGNEIWKRDFKGSTGLFSIILKPCSDTALKALIDGFQLIGLGFGWGGFESLCSPFTPTRVATAWKAQGPAIRFHIGLEDPNDIIADLKDGFRRLTAAA